MANPKKEARPLSSSDSFSTYDSAEEASNYTLSPDSGISEFMDSEEKRKVVEDLTRELVKTQEEINTLRQVLSSKIKHMQDVKRKLGITVWTEFKDDMEQGLRNVQETNAYQKTSQTLKTVTEKTTEAFGTIGATVTKKLEEVKQSTAFKNMEGKVGSVYSTVKTKVTGATHTDEGTSGEALIEKSNESQIPAEKS